MIQLYLPLCAALFTSIQCLQALHLFKPFEPKATTFQQEGAQGLFKAVTSKNDTIGELRYSIVMFGNKGLNVSNETGWTALTYVAAQGHIEKAKDLIREGALVNQRNQMGFTPIMCAVLHNHVPMVELFIANKADLKGTLGVALSLATQHRPHETCLHSPRVLNLLLKAGAPVEELLQYYYAGAYCPVFRELIKNGLEKLKEQIIGTAEEESLPSAR